MSERDDRERNDREGEDRGNRGERRPQGGSARRDGDRPHRGAPRQDGKRSYGGKPARDGERLRRDGDRPGYGEDRRQRDGDRPRSAGDRREGDRPRSGDRRPQRDGYAPRRDGSRPQREGDRPRSGEQRPRRDGGRPRYGDDRPRKDGDRPRYGDDRQRRDGDRPRSSGDRPRRDGDRPRYDGDRPRRDGDRPRRDGDRPRYGDDRGRRDGDRADRGGAPARGGTRGGGRSDRGGRDREFTEAERLQHELRPVRAEHDDPPIPDDVTPKDLHPSARNELKTLQAETQEVVARHLAMVVALIEDDPERAHQHAISASRRAGRIPVAREMLAATAYRTGDYALALRELRTHRRLSGSQGNIALMVESERALGRPQKALETGLEADRTGLNAEQRAQLAIAMSGARLDLGQTQQALFELEIAELDPNRAFSYSPELFAAYASVLEELGREAEASKWRERAERAADALDEVFSANDQLEVYEIYEHEPAPTPEPEEDPEAEQDLESGEDPETGDDRESVRESEPSQAEQPEQGEGPRAEER